MNNRKQQHFIFAVPALARQFWDATGVPDYVGSVKAHTAEVRRAQDAFQRQMQWTVDHEGLDGLAAKEARDKTARRAAWKAHWRAKLGPD